jgi:hypothetical protein
MDRMRAGSTHSRPLKILMADAVGCEPVSNTKFPANREKNREFCGIRLFDAILRADKLINSGACSKIPYSTEQGIFTEEQGIWRQEQGI